MFQITFFVDDKNLGEAFKRLAGIGRNVTHVYMPNLEGRPNGKLRVSSEDSMEMLTKEFHRRHLTEVNATVMKEVVGKLGFSPTSYSHFLQQLVKAGVLKKGAKKAGVPLAYIVTGK